jgi:LuxR family maltose regulon positive regulatory protein
MFVHRLKLRPPQLLPTWIGRPGVQDRLGASASVLSVVAGPGYGKTVIAARIFESWRGPKGWYSLDEADSDLAVFAGHLEAMLATFPQARAFTGDSSQLGSPKEVGSLFAELLGVSEEPPLLVFDDVHALEGSASLAALGELLERSSRAGVSFVLCGRSMPLSLHAVAARSRLASAGAAELAFDAAESRAYLQSALPVASDPATLDRLAARAEGWPAGLALVASTSSLHRAEGREGLVDARDDETRRLLFSYLAAEVLDGLTERERKFLLDTSILDILEREMCDAVTASTDAAEILPSLARRGLFVTRRSEDAYNAHQLFREFLRDALGRSRSREEIELLHRRAAAAFERRGDRVECLVHTLEAGDLDRAAAVLEREASSLLSSGLLARVAGFLERIGRERVERSPALLTALGRIEQGHGHWDRSFASLEKAMRGAKERDDHDVLAEAVRVASSILAARGEFSRMIALLEETLALSDLGEASRTTLSTTLGAAFLETGRFDEALAVFGEITPSVVARGDLTLQGKVLHNTGVAHMRRGDPYAALAMYDRALRVKRSAGLRLSALVTLGNQIFALRQLGDLDEAERLSLESLDEAYDIGNASMVAHALDNSAALKLLRGDLDAAQRAYREAERICDPGDVLVLPDILHGLAQTALGLGNVAEADELCAKAVAMLRATDRDQQIAPILVTRVECAIARAEYGRALALAEESIELAGRGADAIVTASTGLDVAAALVRMLPKLSSSDAGEAESVAAAAAANAIALLHQRDYRFLLRTKSQAFAGLTNHLRRWEIGQGLMPDSARPSAAAALRIEMLGGLRVLVYGEAMGGDAWKRRRARDIFAYLVSLRGRAVSRARLIDMYWPETDADAAHDNLRVTVSAIRKALGDVVKFESNGYRFVPPQHTVVDAELFDEHVDTARQAVARGAIEAARHGYMAAVELYRGDFLEGCDDGGWQWRERERLHAACLEALRWLAADDLGDRSVRRLALDRLLEFAPYDIDAVRMRLRLLVAESRIGDARRDYAEWKARYRTAVGTDPPEVWDGAGLGGAEVVPDLLQVEAYAGAASKRVSRAPSPGNGVTDPNVP